MEENNKDQSGGKQNENKLKRKLIESKVGTLKR